MAGCLNTLTRTLLASLLLAAPALAEQLRDPTRPPGADMAALGLDAAPNSGLQSILRRQGQKPLALINGELVALGGKVGQSTLVEIKEDSVVLRASNGEREIMTLTPGVTRTAAHPTRTKPSTR